MDKPRIRAATAADVPAIANIVDQAYRHYIARIGRPPGPSCFRLCTSAPATRARNCRAASSKLMRQFNR